MKKEEYILHREKIASTMPSKSVLVLFANHSGEFKSAPNKNFYYATGISEVDDKLIIAKDDNGVYSYIFINPYDEYKAKWVGAPLSDLEVSDISGINNVRYLDSFEQTLNQFIAQSYNLYFDFVSDEYCNDEVNIFANKLKEKYPYVVVKQGRGFLQSARTVKTEAEIEEIKKAISITNKGIMALLDNMNANIYEYQLESYFDQAIKFNGASGYSFDTIAASGANSCCLHYSDNNTMIKDGDLVLFDLGATYNHYCADISRTFPASKKYSPRQKQLYNIVLECQNLVLNSAKPGLTTRDLNNIVINFYAKKLKEIGLIKEDSEVKKYYYHGVSHHLGLDCHDLCDYTPLKEGSVISNEPGLYIAEENIGIRIEDDILITKDGAINLSKEIIKDPDEIEAYLSK